MATISYFDAGPLREWQRWSFTHPQIGKPAPGKLFLAKNLGLTGMEVSLNILGPGRAVPFFHRHHEHEEFYLVLSGRGEFKVDGELYPVQEGSAIRIAPEGVRSWRNTGEEPMIYIVVQATAGSLKQTGIEDGEVVPYTDW